MQDMRILGICDNSSGYGQMTTQISKQLERLTGRRITFHQWHASPTPPIPLDPFMADRLSPDPAPDEPLLCMAGPWTPFPDGSVILTMWEATRLKPEYVANLNRARMVIVPCFDNEDWFRASGVTVPIRVVPLGIDPKVYYPKRIPDPKTPDSGLLLRFGASGRTVGRKGLMQVLFGFLAAFEAIEDVQLELKVYSDTELDAIEDNRVRVIRSDWSEHELAAWYRRLDWFVSASRGEGWGLQPHQALACGTPVIAPLWGGHKMYMHDVAAFSAARLSPAILPLEYTERPSQGPTYETPGAMWCEVNHGSLVKQFRKAYDERSDPSIVRGRYYEAYHDGRLFDWEHSAWCLGNHLEESGLYAQLAAEAA